MDTEPEEFFCRLMTDETGRPKGHKAIGYMESVAESERQAELERQSEVGPPTTCGYCGAPVQPDEDGVCCRRVEKCRDRLDEKLDRLRTLAQTAADARAALGKHDMRCEKCQEGTSLRLDHHMQEWCNRGFALHEQANEADRAVVEAILKGGA